MVPGHRPAASTAADAARPASTGPAQRHLGVGFAILVLFLALRLLTLDADPALVTTDNVFLTDEGWYIKAALVFARFGELTNPFDFNVFTHSFGLTAIQAPTFLLFGASLTGARAITVVVATLGLAAIYIMCRRSPYPYLAEPMVLLIGFSIVHFTYSGLALADPTATGLGLIAIALWVVDPGRIAPCVSSLAIAGLAALTKTSYLFTMATVSLLWLATAASAYQRTDLRRAGIIVTTIVVVVVTSALIVVALALLYPDDWRYMSAEAIDQRRVDLANPADILLNFARMIGLIGIKYFGTIGFLAAAAGAAVYGLVRMGRTQFIREVRALLADPVLAALGLWVALGLGQFGLLTHYHPQRYYLFTLFPTLYATFAITRRFGGRFRWLLLGLAMAVFLAGQAAVAIDAGWPADLLARSYHDAAQDMARRAAADVPGEPSQIVIMGDGLSGVVALFDARLRPTDIYKNGTSASLCERVAYWRPSYVILWQTDRESRHDLEGCATVAGTDEVSRYELFHNRIPRKGGAIYYRLRYRSATPS